MAAEEAKRVFSESVHRLIKTWPILKISQQQGYGGQNSLEKIDWLADAVVQIFFDNDLVYPDEVEDFISEYVYNEFDTIAEDQSLLKNCQKMCRYYKLCSQGNSATVVQEVGSMPVMQMPTIQVQDDEEDDETEVRQSQGPSSSNHAPQHHAQMETDEAPEEDDGWQVVQKSKNKR